MLANVWLENLRKSKWKKKREEEEARKKKQREEKEGEKKRKTKERGKDPPHPSNTAQLQLISRGIFILHSSARSLSRKEGSSRLFISHASSYVCKEEKRSALKFFYWYVLRA